MLKKKKISLKVGDTVTMISGFYKTKTGKIIQINRKTGKIIIKGVNLKFKHIKPSGKTEIGEIKQFETYVDHSNVKLNLN